MSRQERVKRVRRWTALTVVAVGVLWRPAPHLSAQARPQPVKSVRLYVFDLGMLKIPDPKNFGFKKEELALTDLSVIGYLIVHPKGTLIWDTGVVLDSDVGTAARGADRAVLRNIDEYDVFGDGTVVIKASYGHTPGHQVLMLNLARTGRLALVGDLYHYPEERTARTIVPSFEYNREQSIATRNMIEDYVKKVNARMWIEHDAALHAKMKRSPAFYE